MKKRFQWAVILLTASLPAGPLMAQRPLGIDVSSYQGTITWSHVYAAGIKFAFAKSTEGNYYQDAYFAANMANGKAAGVQMGTYHYARPDLTNPGTEAAYFWSFAQSYLQHDGKTIMPALDLEVFSGVVGATSYADWANQWSADVASSASAVGLTVRPCIYISACSACNLNTSITPTPWIADWNGESYLTGTPWSTCTGCEVWGSSVWSFWQFSDKGHVRGITGGVDEDTYNGTYAGLVASEGI
ncbi:MAG TPA: glycoside hydrolase family 25 protein [Verrucomicrobiae bacterium]|nr:glycoside hydrolase family 25 protein [Verrucomicrobiae bacterium]